MCGIFCSISPNNCDENHNIEKELQEILQNRGPDSSNTLCAGEAFFAGYVLWQQGDEICNQPLENDDLILLFNGDVFNVDQIKSPSESDTEWLGKSLTKCKNDDDICNIFRTIKGPYSVIFYKRHTKDLYFARDSLGRNSLIIERNNCSMRITSTSYVADFKESTAMELPPLGVYKLNPGNMNDWTLFPWDSSISDDVETEANSLGIALNIKIKIDKSIDPQWLQLDCNDSEPSYNFYDICKDLAGKEDTLFEQILCNEKIRNEVGKFSKHLERSVKIRVEKTPKLCRICLGSRAKSESCNHSKIAILFSGGIDCTILALLADKYIPEKDSIDLINVAFQKANSIDVDWNVPDRLSAEFSFIELSRLCPLRKWNFIKTNVLREDLNRCLSSHIKHLIYPLDTVLDESLGCAFWFASRGRGSSEGGDGIEESTSRVVIVGSGADELFGGYRRHRNAYMRCPQGSTEKQNAVHEELCMDWKRIPSRNLARDDRVVADNGKTLRAPFIEEDIVQFVRNLRGSQRCCFLLAEGLGDKLFLRLCGYKLGLRTSVFLRKRAIQFGSRIANKNQNGAHQSESLKAVINSGEVKSI